MDEEKSFIQELMRLFRKTHADILFGALVEGDKSFSELSELANPTAVHDIMKMGEDPPLNLIESYYDQKTGYKMFKLLAKKFTMEITDCGVLFTPEDGKED